MGRHAGHTRADRALCREAQLKVMPAVDPPHRGSASNDGKRTRAGVAVVGAGAIGLAVALQLRRAGVSDVLVVDRNAAPGMGSTGRANGGVRAQFATPINIVFSQYTIAALIDLDDRSGGQVGYRPVGYLFMAGTELSAEALESARAMQCSLGVPTQWSHLGRWPSWRRSFASTDCGRRHSARPTASSIRMALSAHSAARGGGWA